MATRTILFRGQTRRKGERTSISGIPLPGIWVAGGVFPQNKGYDYYLTKLLNGGLMGERGSKPLRIAIEACELQIPKQPISKNWSPNLCPHCDADLGGDCNDGYYQNLHYERCPVCGQKLKYI